MTKYLISFNDGDMKFPESELPDVARDAHAVMRQAIEAGVWVFGGGFQGFSAKVAHQDGSVTDGPLADSPIRIGGFCVVDVETETEALDWAKRVAVSCHCAQEVRRFMDDPEQDQLLAAK